MPCLNGSICSEVWIFEECIPNELWDRSVLIQFDSLLWDLENSTKIQYLPCIRSCILWDVGMKSLALYKDFCAWLPWHSSPLCLPGSALEPGGGKKSWGHVLFSINGIQGWKHLGVFKYGLLQLCEGWEKRNSVTGIILRTAGFRISVLSNMWDSGKQHFCGWKERDKDNVLEPD